MAQKKQLPIINISPEAYGLPVELGPKHMIVRRQSGGGMGDITKVSLIQQILNGLDTHYLGANYKKLFQTLAFKVAGVEYEDYVKHNYNNPNGNVHLLTSKHFNHLTNIYSEAEITFAAMQDLGTARLKELIQANNGHTLIHGHDQAVGVMAAYAKARKQIYVHRLHNFYTNILSIHDFGHFDFSEQDKARRIFWKDPNTRTKIDSHATAIKNADALISVGKTILEEIVNYKYHPEDLSINPDKDHRGEYFEYWNTLNEITIKYHTGQTEVIPNAIAPDELPENQDYLDQKFGPETIDILAAKNKNKVEFQKNNELKVGKEYILVGWTSRLENQQKGAEDFLNALEELLDKNENVQVAINADPATNHEHLKTKAEHLANKYKGRVAYNTFDKQENNKLYSQADVIVGNSRREPFGLYIAQAVAAGAIVTAPNNGGSVDILKALNVERGTGCGVLFNDPNRDGVYWGMQTAVNEVVTGLSNERKWNEQLRDNMNYIREEFSETIFGQREIEIFEKTLFNVAKTDKSYRDYQIRPVTPAELSFVNKIQLLYNEAKDIFGK